MSEIYRPPFTMTEEITNLVIEIGEQAGAVAAYDPLQPNPILRRENHPFPCHKQRCRAKPDIAQRKQNQIDAFFFGDRAEYAHTGAGE